MCAGPAKRDLLGSRSSLVAQNTRRRENESQKVTRHASSAPFIVGRERARASERGAAVAGAAPIRSVARLQETDARLL